MQPSLFARENNFDFLRFVAALLVIIQHSFLIYYGIDNQPDVSYLRLPVENRSYGIGSIGVSMFFIISGFLITASWEKLRSARQFLKNRVLRIYPGLLLCYLFMIGIIGAIATDYSVSVYFSAIAHSLYVYVISYLFLQPISLPNVFMSNPYSGGVNISLWILSLEFIMYLQVCLLGICGLLNKYGCAFFLMALVLLLGWQTAQGKPEAGLIHITAFMMGALYYFLRDKMVTRDTGAIACFIGLLVLWLDVYFPTVHYSIPLFLHLPLLVYLVMHVAFSPRIRLHRFAKYGDFSYGLYIYGFPMQQLVVWYYRDSIPFVVFSLLSFGLTLAMAAVSWHVVEKRALRLKN